MAGVSLEMSGGHVFALFLLLLATIGFGATLLGLLGINAVEQLGWGS